MFENTKFVAAIYFIAAIACGVTFFSGHRWGYLAAAGIWLALGVYCLIKDRNDSDL